MYGSYSIKMSMLLSLCVVTIIQLTSSQSTYDVTHQQNDVTRCGSSGQSEQVLLQLVNAVSQLQRDVSRLENAVSSKEDVTGKL